MMTRYLITPDRALMDELVVYLTVLEALFAAAEHARKGRVELDREHEGILFAKHTGLSVVVPVGGLVESALNEVAVDGVMIGIEARQERPGHLDQKTSGFRALLASIAERLVVGFFQKSRTDLRASHGQSRTSWPDSWQMGWLVRNAFSHGGLVHFQNAKQSPVQWRGLTLSPTDNGTRLLRDRLNEGDLVVLLLDMEEDLHGPLQQVPDDV